MGDYIFNPDGSLFLMWDEPTIPLVGFDYPGVYKDSLFNPGEAVDPSLPTVPLAGFDRPKHTGGPNCVPGYHREDHLISPGNPQMETYASGSSDNFGPIYEAAGETMSHPGGSGPYYNTLFGQADIPRETPSRDVWPRSREEYGLGSIEWTADAPPLEGLSGQSEDNSGGAAPTPPLLSGSPMLGPNIETPDSPHDATTTGGSNFRQTSILTLTKDGRIMFASVASGSLRPSPRGTDTRKLSTAMLGQRKSRASFNVATASEGIPIGRQRRDTKRINTRIRPWGDGSSPALKSEDNLPNRYTPCTRSNSERLIDFNNNNIEYCKWRGIQSG
ncbi:hypothetical protein BD779DRAFT_1466103 [Infundibulicybe gibba]|nr:hypothetical protein BD779DRAFT_1466103 [Infundibulicybe gibba]